MADIKSANWTIWSNVPELPLWEAVALSLDIEPRSIQFNPNNWATRQKIDGVTEEFEDRLLVAERNLHAKKLPSLDRPFGTPVISSVALDVFAAWALQLKPNWKMPERLAVLANEAALTAATTPALEKSTAVTRPSEKPLGTRERDTLLKMVIGMAVNGYKYNPDAKRNSANAEISSDLEKLGVSVSADTVHDYLKEASALLSKVSGKT